MTFPLFHCSLHSRPHHAVSVQCCCSDTQRHVRSHFDSKALHFRIRPYATSAAFVCQAANVGQLMLCGIHSACPVLSGGGKCWQCMAVRPLLPFRALFGKEKPGQCPPKKLGMYRACFAYSGASMPGSFFAKKAVSTTRQSSPNFINANKKKTRERAQNLRTTVFLYWIKYWLKTLVPVQPPPRVGTATAASRYNRRRL